MVAQPRGVLVVGGGKMGGALVRAWVESDAVAPERIYVVEPLAEVGQGLAEAAGIVHLSHPRELDPTVVGSLDLIVFAVKPQILESVVREFHERLAGHLAVSIAAGVPLSALRDWGPELRWVRAMPNQPVVVRAGVTGLVAGPGIDARERRLVQELFAAVGEVLWLEDEGMLHAVTALSGSGPAFVAAVAEAFEEAGVWCGLSRSVARRLAVGTLKGAALQMEGLAGPTLLREAVTSPGGTTAAGLAALERAGGRAALMAAVRAAWERSRDLAEERRA